jgi:GntR family transcriptional regulator
LEDCGRQVILGTGSFGKQADAGDYVKKRPHKWKDEHPIYRQLMDEVIAGILDRSYAEGQMLPSVRQLAEMYDVNPLTTAKAYRELAHAGLVETLRGEGLAVRSGVRDGLLKRERAKFMKEEWPDLRARLTRLEVDVKMLLATASD